MNSGVRRWRSRVGPSFWPAEPTPVLGMRMLGQPSTPGYRRDGLPPTRHTARQQVPALVAAAPHRLCAGCGVQPEDPHRRRQRPRRHAGRFSTSPWHGNDAAAAPAPRASLRLGGGHAARHRHRRRWVHPMAADSSQHHQAHRAGLLPVPRASAWPADRVQRRPFRDQSRPVQRSSDQHGPLHEQPNAGSTAAAPV
jgi:hypothetical protein